MPVLKLNAIPTVHFPFRDFVNLSLNTRPYGKICGINRNGISITILNLLYVFGVIYNYSRFLIPLF